MRKLELKAEAEKEAAAGKHELKMAGELRLAELKEALKCAN